MSKTRNNHYVPQWYQEGFFEPGKNTLAYLDLAPKRQVLNDGKAVELRDDNTFLENITRTTSIGSSMQSNDIIFLSCSSWIRTCGRYLYL